MFLTAFVPNDAAAAEKNTKIMLSDLSRDYDVDLVYFKYASEPPYIPENEHIRVLHAYKNSLPRKLFNILLCPVVYPTFSVRFNYRALCYLKRRIKKGDYAAIVFDHSQMFLYAKLLSFGEPKIMLSHDVIAQRAGRASNKLIASVCKWSEGYCVKVNNGHVFSFSQKDCDMISSLYGVEAKLCLDYIDPNIVGAIPSKIEESYVFIGKWSRADNLDGVVWFYDTVAPHVKKPIIVNIIDRKSVV